MHGLQRSLFPRDNFYFVSPVEQARDLIQDKSFRDNRKFQGQYGDSHLLGFTFDIMPVAPVSRCGFAYRSVQPGHAQRTVVDNDPAPVAGDDGFRHLWTFVCADVKVSMYPPCVAEDCACAILDFYVMK